MPTPKPGKPVRGSRTGRPIMALLDLLGRRWTLRILWKLREESFGFRTLQDRCDAMSPSVLSQRLRELQEAGIVQQNEDADYMLTQNGITLLQSLAPLNDWALHWAERERLQHDRNEMSSTDPELWAGVPSPGLAWADLAASPQYHPHPGPRRCEHRESRSPQS